MEEQHIFLKFKAIFSLFYAFLDKRSTEELLKIPNIKCLESGGHLWEACTYCSMQGVQQCSKISCCVGKPPLLFLHKHPATAEDENRQK